MTVLLDTAQLSPSAAEITRFLGDRASDPGNVQQLARAAATLLHAQLSGPTISVFALEDGPRTLVLVGGARQSDTSLIGSRRSADSVVLERVVRERTTQSAVHFYVAPDFVSSQPGETRSAVAVPVLIADTVRGVVYLEYTPPQTPSPLDIEWSEAVARALGEMWKIADGQAHAADRRNRRAPTLASISAGLAQEDDMAPVLERIVAAAAEVLGCEGAMLLTRHPSRQMLEVVAGHGALDVASGSLVPLDGTVAGAVARSGRTARWRRALAAAGELLPTAFLADPPSEALLVPIASSGKTSGVLIAADPRGEVGQVFDPEEVRFLQSLADLAGAAKAIRSIGPLRQRISDASLIAEVGRSMTGTLGLDEVLAIVVRAAEMLVSGSCAAVALLGDDGTSLVLAAARGTLRGREGTRLSTRGSVLGWPVLNGEPLITESLGTDPRGWQLGEEFGPAVLVPLEVQGQPRGVLLAGREVGAPVPSDEDLDALRKLGAYAAIGIENARLFRMQTELSRTLQAQTRELEKAYAELRASQERLLISEKMAALGRVTAGIAHEINSPLGSVLNCLQLANAYAEEYRDSANDPEVTSEDHLAIAGDLLDTLDLAQEATRKVAEFVRSIKSQTRMEEERVVAFDPAEEIDGIVVLLAHGLDRGRIHIETELQRGLTLKGDPSKFAVVVQNLVSNAIDAHEDGPGVVSIRLRPAEASLILEVEDRGTGIPEAIRPRVYDYMFTTKDIGRGTGLGLSLAHSIVTTNFSGTIDFHTEVGAGTTFAVQIPVAEN